jgi:phage host-nuclease inhibitor protein Gam
MKRNSNFNQFWPNIKPNIELIKDDELRNFTTGQMNVLDWQRIGDGFVPIKAVSILNMLNQKNSVEFESIMRNQLDIAKEQLTPQNELIQGLA